MKMKKKEGKRNIVFKEQDKILEEKRKNMAEISNLKLNLKKILLSLQNKKKIILNLNDEIQKVKDENEQLEKEKQRLLEIKKMEKENERRLQSQNIHGSGCINTIQLILKNDKTDAQSLTRKEYEDAKEKTNLLQAQYIERMRFYEKLKKTLDSLDNKEEAIYSYIQKPITVNVNKK